MNRVERAQSSALFLHDNRNAYRKAADSHPCRSCHRPPNTDFRNNSQCDYRDELALSASQHARCCIPRLCDSLKSNTSTYLFLPLVSHPSTKARDKNHFSMGVKSK